MKHGSDFEVTLWASPHSQQLRFKIFTQMCDLTGKRMLDAGCSRGDFAIYLIEHQIAFDRFIGVDGLDEVIEYAKSRNLPRCEFHVGDFVTDPKTLSASMPQIICISGSLNTMTEEQLFSALESAWQATDQILLFNFLSDRASDKAVPQAYPAHRHNTMKILDWATSKTPIVRFRQDYFPHGHDATIRMDRD